MTDKEFIRKLHALLNEYHHYKTMSGGFFATLFGGWYAGMNLGDFMQWLYSRKHDL